MRRLEWTDREQLACLLKTIRFGLYGLIGLIVLGLGIYQGVRTLQPEGNRTGLLAKPASSIGGPFTLIDQTGKTVTEKDLIGRPAVLFFGYTYCPDVCPTTLAEAGEWLKALGPAGNKLQVVFVTVDPTRDTQEKLAAYLASFDPRIRGLTGTPDQISGILKAYRVYARKVPSETGGDYLMDHTAGVYLMDSSGGFVGLINYQEETDKALAKLRELVGRG